MRRSLLVIAVAAAVFGANQLSYAADLPVKAPAYKAPPLIAYNWNGFYVGGNIGYGGTNLDSTATSSTGVVGTSSQERTGILGGGQIGYNFMVNPNFLIGIEGDFDGADLTGSSNACDATGCSQTNGKTTWVSTLRGRVGYVANNWLIFATGGAAWAYGSANTTIVSAPAFPGIVGESTSGSSTHSGWTIGGGVEYGFAPHWSAVLQYLYIETTGSDQTIFPTAAADRNINTTSHGNEVRVGINYLFN